MSVYNNDDRHKEHSTANELDGESFPDMIDEYDIALSDNQVIRSTEELEKINIDVQNAIKLGKLNANIGIAQNPVPCKIRKSEEHSTKRFMDRGVTDEDAQSYVDNAVIMFSQHDNRNLYISVDGSSVLVSKTGILVTVIPAKNYTANTKYILGHILKVEEFLW